MGHPYLITFYEEYFTSMITDGLSELRTVEVLTLSVEGEGEAQVFLFDTHKDLLVGVELVMKEYEDIIDDECEDPDDFLNHSAEYSADRIFLTAWTDHVYVADGADNGEKS